MLGRRHLARGSIAVVVLAVSAIVLIVSSSSTASTNADFTGHWSLVDHVTSGPNQGQDFPWEGDWTQAGSALTGTGGYSIVGSVSGSTASFTTTSGGAYVATFKLTMSSDGKSLTGTASDTEGRSFSVTGAGDGKPATPETPKSPETPAPPKSPSPKLEQLPGVDPGKATGRIQSIVGPNFTVIRDGKRYAASQDSLLQTGDILETGKDTRAAVEFLIGGRAGMNTDTQIVMADERSVVDGEVGTKRAILKEGSIWVKADAKTLKHPLEIQTNGGTLGIKG